MNDLLPAVLIAIQVALLASLALLLAKVLRGRPAIGHVVCVLALLGIASIPLWQLLPRSWRPDFLTVSVAPNDAAPNPTIDAALPQIAAEELAVWIAEPDTDRAPFRWTAPAELSRERLTRQLAADANHELRQQFLSENSARTGARVGSSVGESASHGRDFLSTALPLLIVVWILGATWQLSRIGLGWLALRRLRNRATPSQTSKARKALSRLHQESCFRGIRDVGVSAEIHTPIAIGYFRPAVLIPSGVEEKLSEQALYEVFVHEAAHILRRDAWIVLVERIVAALCWPHPFVHWLITEIDRSREDLCDNFVLQRSQPASYSETLLELAQWASTRRISPLASGLLRKRRKLEHRVSSLLDTRRNTMTQLRPSSVGAIALIALSLSAISAVETPEDTEPNNEPTRTQQPQREEASDGENAAVEGVDEAQASAADPKKAAKDAISNGIDWIRNDANKKHSLTSAALAKWIAAAADPDEGSPSEHAERAHKLLSDRAKLLFANGADLDIFVANQDAQESVTREWVRNEIDRLIQRRLARLLEKQQRPKVWLRQDVDEDGGDDFVFDYVDWFHAKNSGAHHGNYAGQCSSCHTIDANTAKGKLGTDLYAWNNLLRRPNTGGLELSSASALLRSQLGLAPGQGLVVRSINPKSSYHQAGIRKNDILASVDNEALTTREELERARLWGTSKSVEIELLRQGQRLRVSLKTPGTEYSNWIAGSKQAYWIGISTQTLDATSRKQLQLDDEAHLFIDAVYPASPAARAGLKKHDILVRVEGGKVESLDALRKKIGDSKGKVMSFEVLRAGKVWRLQVSPQKPKKQTEPKVGQDANSELSPKTKTQAFLDYGLLEEGLLLEGSGGDLGTQNPKGLEESKPAPTPEPKKAEVDELESGEGDLSKVKLRLEEELLDFEISNDL